MWAGARGQGSSTTTNNGTRWTDSHDLHPICCHSNQAESCSPERWIREANVHQSSGSGWKQFDDDATLHERRFTWTQGVRGRECLTNPCSPTLPLSPWLTVTLSIEPSTSHSDPVVVMGLAVVFIGSVVVLHLINKATRLLMK